MTIAAPEIDVEQLMTRISEEVARHKRQMDGPAEGALPSSGSEPPIPAPSGLAELLRHDGADCIAQAYRTLLRREPESGVIEGRLPALEQEGELAAKLDMFREICASEEGRKAGAEIRGLTRPYRSAELLGGDDPAFIAHSYQVLLGRTPDQRAGRRQGRSGGAGRGALDAGGQG